VEFPYSRTSHKLNSRKFAPDKVIDKKILHLLLLARLLYAALSLPNGAELHSLSLRPT
jgi:hypothetical protein